MNGAITVAIAKLNACEHLPDRIRIGNVHALKRMGELLDRHERALQYVADSGFEPARPYARRRFLATTRAWSELDQVEKMQARVACQRSEMEYPEHCRFDKDGVPFEDPEGLKAYSEQQAARCHELIDELLEESSMEAVSANLPDIPIPGSMEHKWPRLRTDGLDGAEGVAETVKTFTGSEAFPRDFGQPKHVHRSDDGETAGYAAASLSTEGGDQ